MHAGLKLSGWNIRPTLVSAGFKFSLLNTGLKRRNVSYVWGICSMGLKCIGACHILWLEGVGLQNFIDCMLADGVGVVLAWPPKGFNDADPLGLAPINHDACFLFFAVGKCNVLLVSAPADLILYREKASSGAHAGLASQGFEMDHTHWMQSLEEYPWRVTPNNERGCVDWLALKSAGQVVVTLWASTSNSLASMVAASWWCSQCIWWSSALRFYQRGWRLPRDGWFPLRKEDVSVWSIGVDGGGLCNFGCLGTRFNDLARILDRARDGAHEHLGSKEPTEP